MIGIYAIINKITNRVYIGGTVNFAKRKTTHFNKLRGGKHSNKQLQKEFDYYGEKAFSIVFLEECEERDLKCKEEFYIQKYKSNMYNKMIHCNFLDGEAREKLSKATSGSNNGNYNRKHTQEELQKIRDFRYGKGYIKKPRKSYKKTLEELMLSRKRMSELMKGHAVSEETKKKIADAKKGKTHSEETKLAMSVSRRGDRNANSKLTKEQVLEIYEKMNNGVSYKKICEQYGIGQTQAYKIKRKEHWVFKDGEKWNN